MDLIDSESPVEAVKIIFKKFLNITSMAKPINSNMHLLPFDEKTFDVLFDLHLRPLKSTMARSIYKVFIEKRQYPYLTTLDIQYELSKRGIKLNKKEINAWLKALLKAGLIRRGKRRKPATMEYLGRYTYFAWYLTPLGDKIARWIRHFLEKRPHIRTLKVNELHESSAKNLLKLSLILRILKVLHQYDDWMDLKEIKKRVAPTIQEVEMAIKKVLEEETKILESREKRGFLSSLMRVLGFKGKEFRIGEEGRQIIESSIKGLEALDRDRI